MSVTNDAPVWIIFRSTNIGNNELLGNLYAVEEFAAVPTWNADANEGEGRVGIQNRLHQFGAIDVLTSRRFGTDIQAPLCFDTNTF